MRGPANAPARRQGGLVRRARLPGQAIARVDRRGSGHRLAGGGTRCPVDLASRGGPPEGRTSFAHRASAPTRCQRRVERAIFVTYTLDLRGPQGRASRIHFNATTGQLRRPLPGGLESQLVPLGRIASLAALAADERAVIYEVVRVREQPRGVDLYPVADQPCGRAETCGADGRPHAVAVDLADAIAQVTARVEVDMPSAAAAGATPRTVPEGWP